ncbi:M48 family metalloprotease [Klebsiella aerogenes]|uniref:hypothetical protein n=1 Tax=Klebsiella aerogenes TaxID=548 RepID=UPI0005EEB2E7|nr:hypothetical protein [Klebsiella aerogenes]EIV5806611.1 hypothetical protein [Klebsiella aerogenes]EIV5807752.1 hypothetical protein [Klebsiella aerogenes]KJP13757.1 hypothetical protein SR67_06935 [Klebsiella aerogenes]MBK0714784.1 hypothetical protein [Klebsiella aerogenes]MEB5842981.1 hypothetical protein [Klebsiella aerogenes]
MKFENEINTVLKDIFGIDHNVDFIHFEVIYKDDDPEKYSSVKDGYKDNLLNHDERERLARELYIGEDFILHATVVFPLSEVQGLESKSLFYYPICTREEIQRIECISSADDYLLALRAKSVAYCPRLTRVFLHRRNKNIQNWSLSSYYQSNDFEDYIDRLPDEMAKISQGIAAGYALSREPHGVCISNEHGKIIVVSEALKHFLFYMNAHFKGVAEELDHKDTDACLFIACRTMLLTETQDFDLDPRGDLPDNVKRHCTKIVNDQLAFIIGHEYAHALLGHFGEDANLTSHSELLMIRDDLGRAEKYFTPRQHQEFDADAGSILHADYDDEECADVLNGAVLFFLYIDIFYAISNYINPPFNASRTHPDPIERLWALRAAVLKARTVDVERLYTDQDVKDWIKSMQGLKDHFVNELLPYGIEYFETYGSVYLPSYRQSELLDRLDF